MLEAILRRDRAIIIAALSLLTVLAWTDLVWLADDMSMGGMDMTGFRMIPAGQGLMMPASEPWKLIEFGYVLAMWVVMMIGMMTPSAAPMILIYGRVGRQAAIEGKPFAATAWFVGGYLLAWIAFSLVATSAQWMLERAMLLTPMMVSANNLLGGLVLIAAGLYQWTPLKEACLFNCQAPLTFITRHGGFRGHAPASTKKPPANRATIWPRGITFSSSTRIPSAAIQKRFMTPPTNKSTISAQQQPTQ